MTTSSPETPGTGSTSATPVGPAGPAAPTAPEGARFDPVTGAELRGARGGERRESFALQPGEPVASFNLVSSMLPLASGSAPQTYRWALALGVLVPVVAGALGFLAFAFVAAALVVPAVYVVYLYDVNQWEDEPVPVVLGALALAAALGVGFTLLWHGVLLGDQVGSRVAQVDLGGGTGGIRLSSLLVLCLLVPVVSEVLKQVGPLVLAARPAFDDMIDGLTFGVAAGAAYAAAETIVVNRALFGDFGSVDRPDAGFWVSLILSAAIVKPIVYGAASGIAVASFSGLGEGYDGFRPAYLRGLAEAVGANIALQAGLFVAARFAGTTGAVIGLVWGVLVAGVLVVRLRHLLHFAVLEAAVEAAAVGREVRHTARGTAYCPSCEMPLLTGAAFCVTCGTSVRAGNKVTRTRNRTEDDAVATPARPALTPTPAGVAPRDNSRTAVVVAAVVGAIVVAGVIGQAVAAAASSPADEALPDNPVVISPQLGSGPETEPAPAPAPVPGPAPSATPAVYHPFADDTDDTEDETESPSPSPAESEGSEPTEGSTEDPGDLTGVPDELLEEAVVGGGISFGLPDGWEVLQSEDGFVVAASSSATFVVQLSTPPADLDDVITTNLQGLQDAGLQELEVTDPETIALPTSSVVSAATLDFRGLVASEQGGALPVDGFSYYFVRQDGTGIAATALYDEGALVEGTPLADDLTVLLDTLVSTF